MKKIYLACSLTHAPEDFKNHIAKLKDSLRHKYEVTDFLGLELGTPQDVFKHDIGGVKTCDLLLADCSHPSTGLGFEIATALYNHKPVLGVAHGDAEVSRFILGINNPLFSLVRYRDTDEVLDAVEKKIAGII